MNKSQIFGKITYKGDGRNLLCGFGSQGGTPPPEMRFVTAVTAGGSVKFLPVM